MLTAENFLAVEWHGQAPAHVACAQHGHVNWFWFHPDQCALSGDMDARSGWTGTAVAIFQLCFRLVDVSTIFRMFHLVAADRILSGTRLWIT